MSHDQELAEVVMMMAELFTGTVGISPDMLVKQQVKFMEDVSSALRDLVELQKQRQNRLDEVIQEQADPEQILWSCRFEGDPPNGFQSWNDWFEETKALKQVRNVSIKRLSYD